MRLFASAGWKPSATGVSKFVLDASAILALVFAEDGADAVIPRLPGGLLSAVNLTEVTTHALRRGKLLEETLRDLERVPVTHAASLHPETMKVDSG
jgi:PIN domain nuclease of toxin-antitoxin system